MGLRANAGKGSVERDPKWRRNYDDVFWPGVTGLKKIGHRQVKVYGPADNNQLNLQLNGEEIEKMVGAG